MAKSIKYFKKVKANKDSDIMHKRTDKQLTNLEARITEAYAEAYEDIRRELEHEMAKMDFKDGMTPKERELEATKYNRLANLEQNIAKRIKKASIFSKQDIDRTMSGIYGENYDFGIYQAETKSRLNTSFSLINHDMIRKMMKKDASVFDLIAFEDLEDTGQIKRRLQSQFAQAFIKGESIPKIAKRVEEVTNKSKVQALTIARTETTRCENNARLDAFERCEEAGIELEKVWLCSKDNRVRRSHEDLNGASIALDKEFLEGLRFPGDENAAPEEVINCRCTMVTEFIGVKKSCKLKELEDRVQKMSFDEWREYKEEVA